jgi:hypothetical protein
MIIWIKSMTRGLSLTIAVIFTSLLIESFHFFEYPPRELVMQLSWYIWYAINALFMPWKTIGIDIEEGRFSFLKKWLIILVPAFVGTKIGTTFDSFFFYSMGLLVSTTLFSYDFLVTKGRKKTAKKQETANE